MVVWFAGIHAFRHLSSAHFYANHLTRGLGGLARMTFYWSQDDASEATVAEPSDLPCWRRGGILHRLAYIGLKWLPRSHGRMWVVAVVDAYVVVGTMDE